ncbi:MAG: Bifunctional protein FolD [Candidatus Falkowbacteria bacterium GW2011_GWC2_38_22]|uniref:Bifunctional protein FolD n=1 Tax=Candidatus Falkowbacteria bacterium GW2011_GWE1_38_31 TaxID=1618638 RepID=A0A0G0K455_9BACT|nr:MAG: Bifunctional protein FolD [Candidatus Falkowbacteria bacterium GW2011_GWF2_38_1205]KKQ61025.1 MAG: Bifunctional protein FolD [Candidatus Falkowbacteria bacterium GW2011_GWC2_38_22]KKQ63446.1 MAG: Bifunctional protein FolD [Candidatus Falkowbacteria bacterium GW2011_GWF1_38_22]KKQ65483.1 MAG: Bifunctional protein FolD [Candidatus Falkowbacteria bacterium GW2011_GWE2_38_254]KKQ70210.1 MAG: Bifunctional protein FolD [Candidatus Falkowbacteria bacterium GW2011_GWE1_38_31]KKQ72614.1 MAG: Bi
MSELINGKLIAEKIKDTIVAEILTFQGKRPNLAIILIGEREDSRLYVALKEKEALKVGIDTHIYRCTDTTPESEIIQMIECLNNDELIDAILVQLPLPDSFDTDKIIKAIDPKKDVDLFHPENLKKLLASCNHEEVLPPVLKAVLIMLNEIKIDLKDKRVCLIANSDVFGKSLAHVLDCRGAKTELMKADDKNLKSKTSKADILISAVGRPHFIKKEMVKKDAVVIDIGITKEKGKVLGDVDFDDVEDKVAFITPVPGGVGPMTIAMLFWNTLEIFKKRL